jgi:hypothetical protein
VVTSEELSVVTPADWVPVPKQGSWTYVDYAALPNDGHQVSLGERLDKYDSDI